jgi:hypothetical protein
LQGSEGSVVEVNPSIWLGVALSCIIFPAAIHVANKGAVRSKVIHVVLLENEGLPFGKGLRSLVQGNIGGIQVCVNIIWLMLLIEYRKYASTG